MSAATPMSLRLDPVLRERLDRLAQLRKRSAHALARDAVSRFVDQEERDVAWNTSCQASLQDYQETGLHVTGAAVHSWLETWGTPDEKPAPDAHD